jgi:hypothetical protein
MFLYPCHNYTWSRLLRLVSFLLLLFGYYMSAQAPGSYVYDSPYSGDKIIKKTSLLTYLCWILKRDHHLIAVFLSFPPCACRFIHIAKPSRYCLCHLLKWWWQIFFAFNYKREYREENEMMCIGGGWVLSALELIVLLMDVLDFCSYEFFDFIQFFS